MKTQTRVNAKNENIVIGILVVVLCFVFALFVDALNVFWKLALIMSSMLSFACGMVASDRRIGFLGAFFISFFLSPVVGFIFAVTSPQNEDDEYLEKMRELAESNVHTSSIADQLYKLNELRRDGILTEDEFATQKEKLLNS